MPIAYYRVKLKETIIYILLIFRLGRGPNKMEESNKVTYLYATGFPTLGGGHEFCATSFWKERDLFSETYPVAPSLDYGMFEG